MKESTDPAGHSALWLALQHLTHGAGIQRDDLLEALVGDLSELRRCWHINVPQITDDTDRAKALEAVRKTVHDHLNIHIRSAQPPKRVARLAYVYAVHLNFNTQAAKGQSDLKSANLSTRRNWLANNAPQNLQVSASTSQRYLDHAISQIERQILESGYDPDHLASQEISAIAADTPIQAAEALPSMETEALRAQEQAQARAEEAAEFATAEFEIDHVLIDRDEYLTRLRSHLDSGYRIVCIWGEPGTGKTTLAKRFVSQIDGINPALTIRMTPAPESLTTESLLFRTDMIKAFKSEDIEVKGNKWGIEGAISELQDKIAKGLKAKAVLLDNVEREELIWLLIPAQPKVPVIITMRTRPQDHKIACEELHDFTEPQAREFINRHLADQNEQEAVALARMLGYRPLALEHAVLFVKESPNDISVRSIIRDMTINVADALETVTPPEQPERNISRLYEFILTSLLEHEPSRVVLDAFLATAGQSGVRLRELVYTFIQSNQGGSHDRLLFRAGLRELARRGILREQHVERLNLSQTNGDSRSPAVELSMHALTYHILRSLRGVALLAIEARYLEFLRTTDHLAPDDNMSTDGRNYAWVTQEVMRLTQDGLPDGWLSLCMIDELTWLAVQEPQDDSNSREPDVVRYAVQEKKPYKLDYHTGRWSELDAEEARQLRLAVLVYRERPRSELISLAWGSTLADEPQVPEIRLDHEITPADGRTHKIIDPIPVRYCIDHGISVRSFCGKRFIPTKTHSTESCLDCERASGSAEWLKGMEAALQDSFRQMSAKHPLDSAHFFLIRAKLRRDLERFEEATKDLVFSYDFLLAATRASQYERLAVGIGIIRVANSFPDAPYDWITEAHGRLMDLTERAEPGNPSLVFIRYIRSQSMEKLGRMTEALYELDQVVALVDSGAVDREDMGIDLWQIFSEKEQLERRLGRTDGANATLRRFITEVETIADGVLLVQGLIRSGRYLSTDNRKQAFHDLRRAIRIVQAREPKKPEDYEDIWTCLTQLAVVATGQDESTYALHVSERALRLADAHLPDRCDLREHSLKEITRIKGSLPDDTI